CRRLHDGRHRTRRKSAMSSLQLQNKVILITGALGQAGRAAIPFFMAKGATVAACDIKPAEEFSEAEALRQQYGSERLLYIEANAKVEDQVKSMMDRIQQTFGRLDGCYHNVYTNKVGLIAEQSLEQWEDNI